MNTDRQFRLVCRYCTKTLHDEHGVFVDDETGGDVCGSWGTFGNEPHVPADDDLFAVTVFDDTTLGTVERCETTNVTTFPDIIDDTGQPYAVYGSLAYALSAARDYVTVHIAPIEGVGCMCDFESAPRHGCRHDR